MGAITGLLGIGGGAGGSSFGGPTALPTDPTGNANLEATYNQLGQVAAGQGPNPAMAQYNQNVQNLARQQAGAISSVQGISPALAATLASQQGSAAMQNAAAQGATVQAQQQLGALQQQAGVANSQAQIAAGLQENVNNANEGLANTSMQGSQKFISSGLSGAGSALAPVLSGGGAGGAAGGSLGSGLGGAIAAAKGGEVGKDSVTPPKGENPKLAAVAVKDRFPGNTMHPHIKAIASIYHPEYMAGGAVVPGKAEVAGNSVKNDTVPAMLSPKEIVLPRSITLDKDAPDKAKQFVADLLKKHGIKTGAKEEAHATGPDEFKDALRKAIAGRKKK